jgi:hypothetical protein
MLSFYSMFCSNLQACPVPQWFMLSSACVDDYPPVSSLKSCLASRRPSPVPCPRRLPHLHRPPPHKPTVGVPPWQMEGASHLDACQGRCRRFACPVSPMELLTWELTKAVDLGHRWWTRPVRLNLSSFILCSAFK